jgi:sugar phosphate isomerase/epimerase
MQLTALTTSLPKPLPDAIEVLVELGFRRIDVPPTAASGATRDLVRRHQLEITCVGLEKEMPQPFDLASQDKAARSAAVDYFRWTIEATAALQAPVGYITPPLETDRPTRDAWCEALTELAEHAQKHDVELAIEHFPERLVPTGAATLELLAELNQPALKLLIDVGHCLISAEQPAELIAAAGDRFAYIHFDDNDGQSDLHWPLLTGRLTEDILRETIAALRAAGYQRGLCLELNPEQEDPVGNLRQGKVVLERMLT